MGRVGIEPTTLGLRVRPTSCGEQPEMESSSKAPLRKQPSNRDELQPTEPIPYAHPYAHGPRVRAGGAR